METTSTNLHLTFPSFPGVSNNDNDVAGIDSHMLFGGRIIIPSSRATFWNEPTTLQEFIEDQFQKPTQHDENISNDPIPANRFRVVNLRRDFKIEVQWTDDLREHLSFDRRIGRKTTLASYSGQAKADNHNSEVPILLKNLAEEYEKSMRILFPDEDIQTQKFLKERLLALRGAKLPFPPTPDEFSHRYFFYYRERLADLNEFIISQQPATLAQLWRDRRQLNGFKGLLLGRGQAELSPPVDMSLLLYRCSGSTLALSLRCEDDFNYRLEVSNASETEDVSSTHLDSRMEGSYQPLLLERHALLPTVVE